MIKLISADSLRKTGLLADEAGDLGNLKFGEPGVLKRNAVMAGWDERDRTPMVESKSVATTVCTRRTD